MIFQILFRSRSFILWNIPVVGLPVGWLVTRWFYCHIVTQADHLRWGYDGQIWSAGFVCGNLNVEYERPFELWLGSRWGLARGNGWDLVKGWVSRWWLWLYSIIDHLRTEDMNVAYSNLSKQNINLNTSLDLRNFGLFGIHGEIFARLLLIP